MSGWPDYSNEEQAFTDGAQEVKQDFVLSRDNHGQPRIAVRLSGLIEGIPYYSAEIISELKQSEHEASVSMEAIESAIKTARISMGRAVINRKKNL